MKYKISRGNEIQMGYPLPLRADVTDRSRNHTKYPCSMMLMNGFSVLYCVVMSSQPSIGVTVSTTGH